MLVVLTEGCDHCPAQCLERNRQHRASQGNVQDSAPVGVTLTPLQCRKITLSMCLRTHFPLHTGHQITLLMRFKDLSRASGGSKESPSCLLMSTEPSEQGQTWGVSNSQASG